MRIAFAASLCLALATTAMAGSKGVILSGLDTLGLGGQAVTLQAKLEKDGFFAEEDPAQRWRKDLPGRKVSFSFAGTSIGDAITDDDGIASVTWSAPALGDHLVTVHFAGDKKYAAGAGDLIAGVRDPHRPGIILDIDDTISTASKWQVVKGDLEPPPLPGSVAVVEKLLEANDVVYVTARIKKFQRYTRTWLAKHGLPRLPIFYMEFKKYPTYDEAKYKIDMIGAIKDQFPGVWLGVGDKETDAKAYRHHGLRTLILGETGGVAGAEHVADWSEIDEILFSEQATQFQELHRSRR